MKTKKMLKLEDGNGYYADFWEQADSSFGVWVTLDGVFNVDELKKIMEALEEAAKDEHLAKRPRNN